MRKERITIIGTGAAGMVCAHLLHPRFDIHLYEKNDYIGGHANTFTLSEGEETVCLDTAFVIFNNAAYPVFCRLLDELGVPSMRCAMSFGFQILPANLEYVTRGLSYCFCDFRNLVRPSFLRMLWQMARFHRQAREVLEQDRFHDLTIREYLKEREYSEEFLNHFLVPLIAVTWSIPPDTMMDYPVLALIEFLHNHGALQGILGSKHWRTVINGSQSYVKRLVAPFPERISTQCRITHIHRDKGKIRLEDAQGNAVTCERVILACHADQALSLLADPSPQEQEILAKFRYHATQAVVHTDTSIMPKKRRNWAAWNYLVDRDDNDTLRASFTYHMNTLQRVSDKTDYFVTINDSTRIDPDKILKVFDYEHPIFDLQAIKAQKKLHLLNENGRTYFCGSYSRFGFHEDAVRSGVEVCEKIAGERFLPAN
ncbi:MAG: NAD(P)/FAD-dependent oxidoreductase [Gammaproteobacteria bacterium]